MRYKYPKTVTTGNGLVTIVSVALWLLVPILPVLPVYRSYILFNKLRENRSWSVILCINNSGNVTAVTVDFYRRIRCAWRMKIKRSCRFAESRNRSKYISLNPDSSISAREGICNGKEYQKGVFLIITNSL